MQGEVQGIFDEAISSGFKFSLLESYNFLLGNSFTVFEDGSQKITPISTFVKPPVRLNFLLEILAEMPAQKPEVIVSYANAIGRMFFVNADLLPINGWETIQAPASWKFAVWHSAHAIRLDKLKLEEQTFDNHKGMKLPLLLGRSLASYLDALSYDIKTLNGYRPMVHVSMLRYLQRLNRFCELVDKTELRPAVAKLESTIDTAENGKYYPQLKKDLTDFHQCVGPM
jgi:hypothetical protein